MGHNYFSQPTPSTSSATLNSILTTTASPVIPQKRKQPDIDQHESVSNHVQLHPSYFRLTHSPPPAPLPRTNNGPESNDGDPNDTSTEAVDCICGFAVDDGFSIACDQCSRWCHIACFGIAPKNIPDKFTCWTCKPRTAVEKEKAVRLQREKLGMAEGDAKEVKQRRRSSPGLERKQRRVPNAAPTASAPLDTPGPGKKKRRPSFTQQPPTPTVTQPPPNGIPEEEPVDVDSEPWREYYVHIAQDVIPNDDTRTKLRHHAAHWRGVTALSPSQSPTVVSSLSLETPPPVSVKPLSPNSLNPFLSQNSNPLVLPPAFALHTTQPIPSHGFITPFRSCITPSANYLADPLNAYAHLGMPKPYVHLLGPPFDVALDARIVGDHGRFARWGCNPNAVLRPILCDRGSQETDDESTLGFGVFATKDLKANEEIVLGWEWDDGNAIHLLPALLEAPDSFPLVNSRPTSRPHKIQHIKNQMSNILHALSSTFTTCACGALSKECALSQMAAFVDGYDLNSLLRRKDQSSELDSEDDMTKIDIGPLVGRKRGFRTRERVPFSGGLGGMQMANDEYPPGNGKGFVWDGRRPYKGAVSPSSLPSCDPTKTASVLDEELDALAKIGDTSRLRSPSAISIDLIVPSQTLPVNNPPSEPRPPDPPDGGDRNTTIDETEARMPPKMRKKWMHRELEARKEPPVKSCQIGLGITLDSQDWHQLMPPPPMPASMDPTTISSTSATIRLVPNQQYPVPMLQRSPTRTSSTSDLSPMSPPPFTSGASPLASFAQLSLVSPALNPGVSWQEAAMPSQEEAEICSEDGSKTDIEDNQTDDSVAVSGPLEDPSTPVMSSAESHIEDCLIENLASINNLSSDFDSHAPQFLRTRPLYSRLQDDDDEVDYSPQSPEPLDEQPHEVLPQFHRNSPEVTDIIPDKPDESDDDEARPDDQATSTNASTLPRPVSPPTSPQLTTPAPDSTSPNPGREPSPKPPCQEPPQSQPLPKVKLTLKDFALRLKRQREEQALTQTIQASPVTPSMEGEEDAKASHMAKTQVEISGQSGRGDPYQGPSSNNRDDNARHVNNAVKDMVEDSIRGSGIKFGPETKPKENSATAATVNTNGHLRVSLSHNLSNRPPPLSFPPRPTQQHPVISKANSLDMKQEVLETQVPPLLQRIASIERSVSPISPEPTSIMNRIQEEEGEIGDIAAHLVSRGSLGPLSKRDTNNSSQQPLSRNGAHFPHSPPTAPRFYMNPPPSPSTLRPPPMSPNPSTTLNNNNTNTNTNGNGNRPNLPTAPRALRLQQQQHRSGSGPPGALSSSYPPLPCQNNGSGSSFLPRGPSADRDKERERADWEQRHYRAPPSRRGTGSGRGTPWGR